MLQSRGRRADAHHMAVRMALTQMYGVLVSANIERPWFAAAGVFDACPRAPLTAASPGVPGSSLVPDRGKAVA